MEPIHLLLTLPAEDDLIAEVAQRLARHGDVQFPPPQADRFSHTLDAGILFTTLSAIITAGAAVVSSLAAANAARAAAEASCADTVKTLLEIQQLLDERGQAELAQIGTSRADMISFDQVDAAFLQELLERPV